jgi:ankyrin repeat protein
MLTRTEEIHTLMLHVMAQLNPHPHEELAECVRLLVDAGADINAFNKIADGTVQTALVCAAQICCCPKVLEIMLEHGADPKLRSKRERRTALHLAAEGGIPACCELLLARADVQLEARDSLGCTPLMLVAETGAMDNVKLLVPTWCRCQCCQ